METFTKFEELKDVFENIISFTDNKTFCSCFTVNKRFKEICDKLKNKKNITTSLSSSTSPSLFPLLLYCYYSPDIQNLWKNDNKPFDSLNRFHTYKNESLQDDWIDSRLNRVLEITYKNNKLYSGLYYLKNKKDGDRFEFDFVNLKIIVVNNSKKHELERAEYIKMFIQNYKKLNI